jgi:PST family polysaccharide transporter
MLRQKESPQNFQTLFQTEHLEADLKRRSIRGGTITLASQGFRFALQMGSTIVLARVLTPEDYGLVGMTSAATGFIEIFKDLGLSDATVQRADINHQQVSTLFWINCVVGLGLTVLVLAIAPWVASFYNEPRVTGIMNALSINFLLTSLAAQHTALLKRQMRFSTLAIINVFSMTTGVIVAVIAGFAGAGYWSLVLMFIASVITYTSSNWIACRWRPGWPVFESQVGSMLKFGRNLTGFKVVNYFSRNLDNILIGRLWGSVELGLYAKAYQLILLPINQINGPMTAVAMPALSRLQTDPERYRRYYYKAILNICFIGMPIIGFLFAASREVVLVVLGPQWVEVVPIFQYLMPAAFVGTFNVATGWVFQSLGQTDRQFKSGLVGTGLRIAAFLYFARWGAVGIAIGYSITEMIWLIPRLIYCFHKSPLSFWGLAKIISYPFTASICAAFLAILAEYYLSSADLSAILVLSAKGVLYLVSYISIWLLMPGGKGLFMDILNTISQLKK